MNANVNMNINIISTLPRDMNEDDMNHEEGAQPIKADANLENVGLGRGLVKTSAI